MKSRGKIKANRRWVTGCLVALSFIGPIFGNARSVRADGGDLDNDARLEGYGSRTVVLDSGVAPTYLLLGGLTILAVCVMFKDAKRSHKKS